MIELIEIKETRNEKFFNDTVIECEINHPEMGWIPFACDPLDKGSNIDISKLYEMLLLKGVDPYTPPSADEVKNELIANYRAIRNQKLIMEVDPIVTNPFRWDALTEEEKTKVTNYRTHLLNIPQQEKFPDEVDWGVKGY